MTVDRSGLSRRVNNPYAAADQGSLENISRRPQTNSPSASMSLNQAIQNISNQYRPAGLNRDEVLRPEFVDPNYNTFLALYDPVTGNTLQSRFQAAGGGQAGLDAAFGVTPTVTPTPEEQAAAEAAAQAARMMAQREYLGGLRDTAISDIDASAARASQALSSIDPQAAFQFNVQPASVGIGAAENYLRSIGASTEEVEALRGLNQVLLDQSLAGATEFSDAQQSALDIERKAREAAVEQLRQEAVNAVVTRILQEELERGLVA